MIKYNPKYALLIIMRAGPSRALLYDACLYSGWKQILDGFCWFFLMTHNVLIYFSSFVHGISQSKSFICYLFTHKNNRLFFFTTKFIFSCNDWLAFFVGFFINFLKNVLEQMRVLHKKISIIYHTTVFSEEFSI